MIQLERQPQAYTLEFDRRPNQSPDFIRRQLETHIGERFNVLLSRTNYEIKDGRVFAEGETEPFISVLRRGRDHRRIHGNPADRSREDAEVMGFEKIDKILSHEETPSGAMVLSISPQGQIDSSYQHNFYDIFTKKENHVEARRYSSALSYSEYINFLRELGFVVPGNADAAFFLSNPIRIKDARFRDADELHRFLHRDHEFTTEEEFERIKKAAQSEIRDYSYDPTPFNFNRALNKADIVGGLREEAIEVELGFLPVRKVMTGCGASGGARLESPFSVSEFGEDKYGSLNFKCPHCKEINRREMNKLISNCQHCGKDVTC